MACSAIDERRIRVVFSIVNEDGPEVDKDEERNIPELLEGEQEWEQVVWNGLCEAV